MTDQENQSDTQHNLQPNRRVPAVLSGAVVLIALVGGGLLWHAERATNNVALADSPKPVTYVEAQRATYRPRRSYIGTFDPWVEAQVGPQLVSAYVDTVLVRPGAKVRRGEVLATLDCRNASASSQAVAMQARAIDARQQAIAHEAARLQGMLSGGFVSPNDVEQAAARSAAEQAELEATKAKLVRSSLEVDDCILRSPFDGEIATRNADPGAFVHPGATIVSVIDRRTVRLIGDAPENDFDAVAPDTLVKIHCYATRRDMLGKITRRAPAADPGTRTVHFEIDIADPQRQIPVGTTGEISIDVGEPVEATSLPLAAAAIRHGTAVVFVVENNIAQSHTYKVLGEDAQFVYVESTLAAGSRVVVEGRALLSNGDKVDGKLLALGEPAGKPIDQPAQKAKIQ